MKFRPQWYPILINILACAVPASTLLAGCGGSNNTGVFTPTPAPPQTRPTPTPPHPTPTPGIPAGANFILSSFSSDYNGSKAPLKGRGSFTRRKTATTDGLDATVAVGTNPTRRLTITISTAGSISVGQTFRVGINDAFTSSTGVTYTESRPDPAQQQDWVTQGGPGVAGTVTVVALNATSVSLRVSGARLSRSDGLGPPAAGAFTLNGDLIVPNA